MDGFGWAAAAFAVAVCLIPGIAAAGPGWVLPWLRGRVLRPRLWGWGDIMLGAFVITETVLRTVVFSSGHAEMGFYLGVPFGVLGFTLMALGQRPGRPAAPVSS
jgi:hypothetical protein